MASEDQNNLYFAVPHAFFELRAEKYTPGEVLFYIVLRRLISQLNRGDEWTLLFDAAGPASGNRQKCFVTYGVSARTCKAARKKLLADGIIATRYARDRKGHRIGTEYRLVDERFAQNPRAIHRSIMGRTIRGFEGVSVTQKEVLGEFSGLEGGCGQRTG